jgi:hypothetical protein
MPHGRRTYLVDRAEALVRARDEAQAEVDRLEREERYLSTQIRRAEEQVRYYEGLLADLKRDTGGPAPLKELVRKLG